MKKILRLLILILINVNLSAEAKTAKELNSLGYEAYAKKDYALAGDYFKQAIAADDTYIYAHHNYACTLALSGCKANLNEIIVHLKREIQLNGKRIEKILEDPDLKEVRKTQSYRDEFVSGRGFPFGLVFHPAGSQHIGLRYYFFEDGTFAVHPISEDATGYNPLGYNRGGVTYKSNFAIIGGTIVIRERKTHFNFDEMTWEADNDYYYEWGTIDVQGYIGGIERYSQWYGSQEFRNGSDWSVSISKTMREEMIKENESLEN